MHARNRTQESDFVHCTPKAKIFEELKQTKISGKDFHSLLNESGLHKSLASDDLNDLLEEEEDEEVYEKPPQNSFQSSVPFIPPNASPGENLRTRQATDLFHLQTSKALLFDHLKRRPSTSTPVRVADSLFELQSPDSSAPLSAEKEVCSSNKDVPIKSTSDEVCESRSTSVERNSELNQSGLSEKFLHSVWSRTDLLNITQTLKPPSRMPGSLADAEKVIDEAKPLAESCKPIKKVSSAAKILSSKGSKNDPMTLQDLPVTRRSGRLVIPPLAWWANQRVMVDPTSNATVIAQGNANALDLPAVHFESRNDIRSTEIGKELEESQKRVFEMKVQTDAKDEKQLAEVSSKKQRVRPHKSTGVMMQEMEIESTSSTDVIKNRQGIRSDGGELNDGSASGTCEIRSRPQIATRRGKNQSDTTSVLVTRENKESNCTQKRQRLDAKNSGDYQPGSFSSADCLLSLQVPQQTTPQKNGRNIQTINRKQSLKSDSIKAMSRSSRSCNVDSEVNVIKVPVQHRTRLKGSLMLQEPKVIQDVEKQIKQNSANHCHEKLLSRKENARIDRELEGKKKTRSCPSPKTSLRNESTGEKVRQRTPHKRSSPKVHSRSLSHKDNCSKLSSLQEKSRLNSTSEESWSAAGELTQRRTKKHSIKDSVSREEVEFVYAKSDHLQKTIVMRQDSKKTREHATKDQFSFLDKSPLPMRDLPPKPRPALFHTSGNLSDQCDSDDSANVEYFFSSDDSET